MADLQVPVYILSAESRAVRAQSIRRMFSNQMFDTRIITVQTPADLETSLSREDALDNYRFRKILEYSKERGEGDIVVVKDTSKPKSTPNDVADVVRAVTENTENRADITCLSPWKMVVDNQVGKNLIKSHYVKPCVSENTLYAIVLTPHGRDLLLGDTPLVSGSKFDMQSRSLVDGLNEAIVNKNITADLVTPSLFDVPKRMKRRGIIPTERNVEQSRAVWVSPLAIIFIVLIVLLIVWAIYYYAYRKK